MDETILSIGEDGFPRTLIDALNLIFRVDHLSVLTFDHQIVPHAIGVASREPGNIALEAGRLYERARFYRHDPGAQQLLVDPAPHAPMLFRLRAADVADPEYRAQIYSQYRLAERLSLIAQVRGQWIMLNLYRATGSGSFRAREVEWLRTLSGLLAAIVGKHAVLRARDLRRMNRQESAAYLEHLLAVIDRELTSRERQVCARALMGLTVAGIALDLGVKRPTVATLRQRAFARVHISSLNELFALCIAELAKSCSPDPSVLRPVSPQEQHGTGAGDGRRDQQTDNRDRSDTRLHDPTTEQRTRNRINATDRVRPADAGRANGRRVERSGKRRQREL